MSNDSKCMKRTGVKDKHFDRDETAMTHERYSERPSEPSQVR
jgi:hypothetical protein